MLPIVTVVPAATGVLTFDAVTEVLAPSGTTNGPSPVVAQAIVDTTPFLFTVHVFTAAVTQETWPPTIQL